MPSAFVKYLFGFLLLSVLYACERKQETEKQETTLFRQVNSEKSGITFRNQLTFTDSWNIIEYLYYYNGAGVAAGDINNDGRVDLFFTSNEGSNTLYSNQGNLTFQDITASAGVSSSNWSTGVTMADVNNDGWLDIYVCQVGGYKGQNGRNLLYINDHEGRFKEMAASYGVDFSGLSTQAAFFDYDGDGDQDMYLLNHSVHSVESYGPAGNRGIRDEKNGDRLFKNLLIEGEARFEDVTIPSGIYSSRLGYGLGVVVVDYNRDGKLDLYVSNDFHENDYLYKNNGDGTFAEVGQEAFGHTSRYSMGVDAADLNNDGYPEIITLDMLPADGSILRKSAAEDRNEVSAIKAYYGYGPQQVRNAVQYNWGNGVFSDIAPYLGIHATDWSWSPLIADFDNDGHQDIYITNGIARRPNDLDYIQYLANSADGTSDEALISKMPELRINNVMFSDGRDVTTEWGLDIPSLSNGATYADLDRDGDLDIVVNNIDEEAFLFENLSDTLHSHNWLTLQLENMQGAQVTAFSGNTKHYGLTTTTRGFMSSVPPEIHFGLGQLTQADSLEIIWPDQTRQVEGMLTPGYHQISKKETTKFNIESPDDVKGLPAAWLKEARHEENTGYRDFQREHLIPENLSMEGPAVALGDVNGDGLDDLYVGGAHGKAPVVLEQVDGEMRPIRDVLWITDAQYEDVDAIFFDADNDGDLDLYVVSGGNEYPEGHFLLRDRLYLNDGSGKFTRGRLPEFAENGSVVRAADVDSDGDMDLFVGTRSVPGSYGVPPENHLLVNESGSFLKDESFSIKGMVTDSRWDEARKGFVIAGDWMPITWMYRMADGAWKKEEIPGTTGLWKSLALADTDGDGQLDVIAGNLGLNTPLSSGNATAIMLVGDFDKNGQTDPIIFVEKQGEMVPFSSKDDLAKQLPLINKTFVSYKEYAEAQNLPDYFRQLNPTPLWEYRIDTFGHMIITTRGEGNAYEISGKMQWTQIDDITEANGKIVFAGNSFRPNVALGRIDAVPLFAGTIDGGQFQYDALVTSQLTGDIRRVVNIDIPGSEIGWIIFRNGDAPLVLDKDLN